MTPKNVYASTGILIPRGQAVSEIQVTRYSEKQVSAVIEQYAAKTRGYSHMCRVFDPKEMVSKHDIE